MDKELLKNIAQAVSKRRMDRLFEEANAEIKKLTNANSHTEDTKKPS